MKPLVVLCLLIALHGCYAPPVTQNKEEEKNEQPSDGLEDYMEYHRYLREVVNALESDPEFRQKLEKATEDDIRSGKIASELEFVSHNVRTRLDEIKRTELQRLRKGMDRIRQIEQHNELADPVHHHLDQSNPHTFEIEDLKKLIAKTTEDLAEADKKRREEFKQYEMEKELEKQRKLNNTEGEEREKLEKMYKEQEEKHKKHAPLHEPGHKKQLEEVWEEQDHMQQEFDPKTFFTLHDLDGNNLWDQDEVKALFIKELDKMYASGAPEDDMRERAEEMERMRETVFREVDTNRDGFIDFEEFIAQTKKNDFQQDHGWQTLDQQKPYTDEELEAYIRSQQMHYQYPPQGYPAPPGYQHPSAYQPGYHPNQAPQGYHPNQIPQQPYQQVPPAAGYQAGQVPQHPAQVQQHEQVHAQYYPAQGPQIPQQQQQVPPVNSQNKQGQQQPDLNTNEVYPQYQQNNIPQQQQGSAPQINQQFQQQPPQYHQQQQQQPPYQQQPPQYQPQQQPPQYQQQQPQQIVVQQQNKPSQINPQPLVSQNAQPSAASQSASAKISS